MDNIKWIVESMSTADDPTPGCSTEITVQGTNQNETPVSETNENKGKVLLYPCDVCGNNFFSESSLQTHKKIMGVKHDRESFQCKICSYKFTKRTMSTHWKKHHEKQKLSKEDFEVRTFSYDIVGVVDEKLNRQYMVYECVSCSLCFKDTESVKSHFENNHECIRLRCPFCSRQCAEDYFETHIAIHKDLSEAGLDHNKLFCRVPVNNMAFLRGLSNKKSGNDEKKGVKRRAVSSDSESNASEDEDDNDSKRDSKKMDKKTAENGKKSKKSGSTDEKTEEKATHNAGTSSNSEQAVIKLSTLFQCLLCKVFYAIEHNVISHIADCSGTVPEDIVRCDLCERSFPRDELEVHRARDHQPYTTIEIKVMTRPT